MVVKGANDGVRDDIRDSFNFMAEPLVLHFLCFVLIKVAVGTVIVVVIIASIVVQILLALLSQNRTG